MPLPRYLEPTEEAVNYYAESNGATPYEAKRALRRANIAALIEALDDDASLEGQIKVLKGAVITLLREDDPRFN